MGTPLLADVNPIAATPANEPSEDTPDASDDHDAAKVAATDEGDSDTPHPAKAEKPAKAKHAKAGKAKAHHEVAAKPAHGKHRLAKESKAKKIQDGRAYVESEIRQAVQEQARQNQSRQKQDIEDGKQKDQIEEARRQIASETCGQFRQLSGAGRSVESRRRTAYLCAT